MFLISISTSFQFYKSINWSPKKKNYQKTKQTNNCNLMTEANPLKDSLNSCSADFCWSKQIDFWRQWILTLVCLTQHTYIYIKPHFVMSEMYIYIHIKCSKYSLVIRGIAISETNRNTLPYPQVFRMLWNLHCI